MADPLFPDGGDDDAHTAPELSSPATRMAAVRAYVTRAETETEDAPDAKAVEARAMLRTRTDGAEAAAILDALTVEDLAGAITAGRGSDLIGLCLRAASLRPDSPGDLPVIIAAVKACTVAVREADISAGAKAQLGTTLAQHASTWHRLIETSASDLLDNRVVALVWILASYHRDTVDGSLFGLIGPVVHKLAATTYAPTQRAACGFLWQVMLHSDVAARYSLDPRAFAAMIEALMALYPDLEAADRGPPPAALTSDEEDVLYFCSAAIHQAIYKVGAAARPVVAANPTIIRRLTQVVAVTAEQRNVFKAACVLWNAMYGIDSANHMRAACMAAGGAAGLTKGLAASARSGGGDAGRACCGALRLLTFHPDGFEALVQAGTWQALIDYLLAAETVDNTVMSVRAMARMWDRAVAAPPERSTPVCGAMLAAVALAGAGPALDAASKARTRRSMDGVDVLAAAVVAYCEEGGVLDMLAAASGGSFALAGRVLVNRLYFSDSAETARVLLADSRLEAAFPDSTLFGRTLTLVAARLRTLLADRADGGSAASPSPGGSTRGGATAGGNASFSRLLLNDELSDVSFEVEGSVLPGHRVVLSAVSPPLQAMFTSPMREGEVGVVIPMPHVSRAVFVNLLTYVYTGTCQLGGPDECRSTLALAEELMVDGLATFCAEYLVDRVDGESFLELLALASQGVATRTLLLGAVGWLVDHFEEIDLGEVPDLDLGLVCSAYLHALAGLPFEDLLAAPPAVEDAIGGGRDDDDDDDDNNGDGDGNDDDNL